MHRRLLNLLSALSLLLCVAVCAVWVRSYCAQDVVLFPFARHASSVYSSCGQVLIRFGGFPYPPGRGVRLIRDRATCFDDAGRAGALVGFEYVRFAQPPGLVGPLPALGSCDRRGGSGRACRRRTAATGPRGL